MNPSDKLLIPNYNQQPQFNFNFNFSSPLPTPEQHQSLKLKLPPMPSTRSSARQRANSNASGSEYHISNASMDVDDQDMPEEEGEDGQPVEEPVFTTTSRGRKITQKDYKESSDAEDQEEDDDEINFIDGPHAKEDHNDRRVKAEDDEDEDEDGATRYSLRNRKKSSVLKGFIASSDDEPQPRPGRLLRSSSKPSSSHVNGFLGGRASGSKRKQSKRRPARQSSRRTRANSRQDEQDGNYEDEGSATSSAGSGVGSVVEEDPEDLDAAGEADAEGEPEAEEQENDGKPYAFRQRAKVNYAILPPIEEMKAPPPKPRGGARSNGRPFGRNKAPGWSATGAELSRWMGGADDSVRLFGFDSTVHDLIPKQDSDFPTRTPRKNLGMGGAGGGLFAGSAGTGGLLPGDLAAAAGTPSNLGKIGDAGTCQYPSLRHALFTMPAALADADPLGVNQNVTFDEVGGLDERMLSLHLHT